jgi:uracil-DNA glycosylase
MSNGDARSGGLASRATPASAELLDLVRDLRSHLEVCQELCPADLIPADEGWLTTRREQYRTFQLIESAEPAPRVDAQPARVLEAPAPLIVAPATARPSEPVPPPLPLPPPSVIREPAEQTSTGDAPTLVVLAERVASCTRCALSTTRTQTVFARGTTSSGIVFVGEGPGADEDAQGLPFVGKAGQLLDRMIEAMGLQRDDVYICNVVKCRPPENRKPEESEMAACRPFLTEQLELLQPKVIVALGATAVQGLLGLTMGITRLRGQWRLYRGQIPVMPTFHPAYLLRQPAAKREVWQDLQAVLEHLGRKAPKRGEN